MAIKLQKSDNTGVIYSDPADPGLTIRFKQTEQGKSLNGVPVANHVTEIIINDDNAITVSGQQAIDAVSARLRISGTSHSKQRIRELLTILVDNADQWATEDVYGGFRPVTAPAIGTVP